MARTNMTDTSLGVITDFETVPQVELKAKLIDHDAALDGVATDWGVDPASSTGFIEKTIPLNIPDVATTTYTFNNAEKIEIIDVSVIKSGAGAANTIQVTDFANNVISNAIAADTDKTVTRAGTLDPAFRTIAAAAKFKVIATRAAGSMLAKVYITALCRP